MNYNKPSMQSDKKDSLAHYSKVLAETLTDLDIVIDNLELSEDQEEKLSRGVNKVTSAFEDLTEEIYLT